MHMAHREHHEGFGQCSILDGGEGAAEAKASADPYDLLGIEPTASAPVIKKRYWRLSLLTHPDKCPHPRAHSAFDAVTQAVKALQVPPWLT